jgi:exonuclease III
LYSVNLHGQATKQKIAGAIGRSRDVVLLQETHSTTASVMATAQADFEEWHSHGTQRVAGVSLWIRKSWLRRLQLVMPPIWTEICSGRAAQVELRTRQGRVCFTNIYLHSGDRMDERISTLKAVAAAAPDPRHCAHWIMGDFSFVMTSGDRRYLSEARDTGHTDAAEAERWTALMRTMRLREVFQPEATHRTSSSESRLDRCYTSLHDAYRQDSQEFCAVGRWEQGASAHRPLFAGVRRCTQERPRVM